MVGRLLVRGMIAGLVAGLAAAVFAWFTGEPSVNAAIGLEEAGAHDHGTVELVSRGVQSTVGLGIAVVLVGVALGGIVALVFAFCYGRVGRGGVRATALGVAVAGWVCVGLVPFLKYPANPPGVGAESTISDRSGLYFTYLLCSVVLAVAAAYAWRRSGSALLAGGGYVVAVAVVAWLLPAVNEVPRTFPADVLWDFRIASMALQLVLWTGIGVLFGYLARPVLAPPGVERVTVAR
jgi:hypothetical protein